MFQIYLLASDLHNAPWGINEDIPHTKGGYLYTPWTVVMVIFCITPQQGECHISDNRVRAFTWRTAIHSYLHHWM